MGLAKLLKTAAAAACAAFGLAGAEVVPEPVEIVPVITEDMHPIVAEALSLGWKAHKAVMLEEHAKSHFEIQPLFAGFWRSPVVMGFDVDEHGLRTPRIREPAVWTALADEQPANIRAANEWAEAFARGRGWSTEKGLVWT